MKLGLAIKIDVSKIDKSRIYAGKKGKYIDLTCFIDTENTDQFGNNGTATQSITADERKNGLKLPILGNAKVFYTDGGSQRQRQPEQSYGPHQDREEIPF